jgi:hypothetical protein
MNIQIIEVTNINGLVTEHVIIDRGNDEFTSMTKEYYESIYGPINMEGIE